MRVRFSRLGLAGLTLVLGFGLAARAAARPQVSLLEIEGVINPMTARYLARGLEAARTSPAEAVIVRLDTPGGTMQAMRAMVREILASEVPVVVYVAPAGARAASAGVFITAAAHVAAMAPGTNMGSAHPVSLGGGEQKAGKTMEEKVVNDAAAMARAIAARRGRNAAWLERAVRESVAVTAHEARELNVVDLVVENREALLAALDGQRVQTVAGAKALKLAGAQVNRTPMNLAERILHTITDPNIAYLLFSLGLIGLAAELYHPGMIFPGVVGLILVVLALVAFGSLPVNWGGVMLIALGVGLTVLDVLSAGIGLLTLGGATALLLGALFFYRPYGPISPAMPDLSLSPWLIVGSAALLLGFSGIVARALWRVRNLPVQGGKESLIGRTAVAESPLEREGRVRVGTEVWSAVADENVASGEQVRVVGVQGVTLRVRRA